jgi:hypothetical protein
MWPSCVPETLDFFPALCAFDTATDVNFLKKAFSRNEPRPEAGTVLYRQGLIVGRIHRFFP